MHKIKSFKAFNESAIYDEDFNEYLVKNMLSDDIVKRKTWSLISDLVQIIKLHKPDMLPDLRNSLLHDSRDNALKIAMKFALQMSASNDKANLIFNELSDLRKENSIKNMICLKVKSIIQAEDLKDILESKPWYSKVKIEGHNLLVDLKNNTFEEIKNLISHLPFPVELA